MLRRRHENDPTRPNKRQRKPTLKAREAKAAEAAEIAKAIENVAAAEAAETLLNLGNAKAAETLLSLGNVKAEPHKAPITPIINTIPKNIKTFENTTVVLPPLEFIQKIILDKNRLRYCVTWMINAESCPIFPVIPIPVAVIPPPTSLTSGPSSFSLFPPSTPVNSQQNNRNQAAEEQFITALRRFLSDKNPITLNFYMGLILNRIARYHRKIDVGIKMRRASLFLDENTMLLLNTHDMDSIANAKENLPLRKAIDIFNQDLTKSRNFHRLIKDTDGRPSDRKKLAELRSLVDEKAIIERTQKNLALLTKNKEQFFYETLLKFYIHDLREDYPEEINLLLANVLNLIANSKTLLIFCKLLDKQLTIQQMTDQVSALKETAQEIRAPRESAHTLSVRHEKK